MKYWKAAIAAAALAAGWVVLSRVEWLSSVEGLRAWMLGWGPWAPAFFIGIQVLQVIVAPIPGQAAGFAGGFVFGWKAGLLYTMIGLALGSAAVLALARRYGRPFLDRLGVGGAVAGFERIFESNRSARAVSSNGLLAFFVIMLLPGLPDDLVCFAAGLSRIPVWQLLAAAVLGRLPGMLVLSMAGAGFSTADTNRAFAGAIAGCAVIAALYLWKKDAFQRRMRRLAGLE